MNDSKAINEALKVLVDIRKVQEDPLVRDYRISLDRMEYRWNQSWSIEVLAWTVAEMLW